MSNVAAVARPYAKAAFLFALERKELESWRTMLQQVSLVILDPTVQEWLTDPAVTQKNILEVLLDMVGSRLDPYIKNFLRLLVEYHRLGVLPMISQEYELLMDEHLKVVDAEVVSAFPISEALQETLKKALEKKFQSNIQLNVTVDPKVLGGALIKMGDKVIDGTVLRKLHSLQHYLTNAKETLCQPAP